MKCFYCKKEIDKATEKFTALGLDRPYINLPFHTPLCMGEVKTYGIDRYIADNLERIYDVIEATGTPIRKVKRG